MCSKNHSFLNFCAIGLAEYTLFLSIQSIKGLTTTHHRKRDKYIKMGMKARNLSIRLASTLTTSLEIWYSAVNDMDEVALVLTSGLL